MRFISVSTLFHFAFEAPLPLLFQPSGLAGWCDCLYHNQPTNAGGHGICLSLDEPRGLADWRRSPGPGTGDAGYRHDAATFLHHHVNVSPHDLGDLSNLKSKTYTSVCSVFMNVCII